MSQVSLVLHMPNEKGSNLLKIKLGIPMLKSTASVLLSLQTHIINLRFAAKKIFGELSLCNIKHDKLELLWRSRIASCFKKQCEKFMATHFATTLLRLFKFSSEIKVFCSSGKNVA